MTRPTLKRRSRAARRGLAFDALEPRWLLSAGVVTHSSPAIFPPAEVAQVHALATLLVVEGEVYEPALRVGSEPDEAPFVDGSTRSGSVESLPIEDFENVLSPQPGRFDATIEFSPMVPEAGSTLVNGRVEKGVLMDLYRVPASVRGFRVQLTALDPEAREADQLFLLDGQGRVMRSWSLPDLMNRVTIDVRMTGPAAGRWFYVGVGPSSGQPARSSEAYALAFLPIAGSASDGALIDASSASAWTPFNPTIQGSSPDASGTGFGQGASVAAVAVSSSVVGGGVMAPGQSTGPGRSWSAGLKALPVVAVPTPVRLAAPFGGLLAGPDDPATRERQEDAGTLIELGLLPLDVLSLWSNPDANPSGPDFRAIEGPGGIPLVAAIQARPMPRADAAEVPSGGRIAGAEERDGWADLAAAGPAVAARRWFGSRMIPVGMSLMTMVAVTLILPDLMERRRRQPLTRAARRLRGWLRTTLYSGAWAPRPAAR
jgi:hypothetical protein